MENVEEFLSRFGFRRADCLALYIFGSRLYGCHRENSDYDYWLILQDEIEMESDYIVVTRDNFDVNCYLKRLFCEKLRLNELQSLMCWFQDEKTCIFRKFDFDVEILFPRLKVGVLKEASRHMHSLAPRHLGKGEIHLANKSRLQAMRDLMFGIQIATKGCIYDYAEANQFIGCDVTDEMYDKYVKRFELLMVPEFEVVNASYVSSFLYKYSLTDLRRFHEVEIFTFPNSDLVVIYKETPDSKSVLERECNGIVVTKSGKLVCKGFPHVLDIGDHFSEKVVIQFASFFAIERDVQYISVFCHGDIWFMTDQKSLLAVHNENHWKFVNDKRRCKVLESIQLLQSKETSVLFIYSKSMNSLRILSDVTFDQHFHENPPLWQEPLKLTDIYRYLYSFDPWNYTSVLLHDENGKLAMATSPQSGELTKNLSLVLSNPSNVGNLVWIECCLRNFDASTFLLQFPELKRSFHRCSQEIAKKFDILKDFYQETSLMDKKEFSQKVSLHKHKIVLMKLKELHTNGNAFDIVTFLSALPSHLIQGLFDHSYELKF